MKRLKTRLRSSLNNDMLSALMHVSINGPKVHTSECGTLIAETVKEWLTEPRRRLARGKEMNASKRVDVGVQVENATYAQEDMDQ